MKQKMHQKEVCEAVIGLMEKRKNESIKKVSVPDENERNKKAVDLHLSGDNTEYHLEHTLIESFPEQITDGKRIMNLLAPLEKTLASRMPPGHFGLAVSSGAVAGATDTKNIQSSLTKWILEKAPLLSEQASAKKVYIRHREIPPNVPFEVELSCESRLDDGFYVCRFAPEELEVKRRERVHDALGNKCPKLKAAKVENGSRSVLVLESNDIALANHIAIANAFTDELNKRTDDIPDEAYLVETEIPKRWVVWVLKEGDSRYPNILNVGPHYLDR